LIDLYPDKLIATKANLKQMGFLDLDSNFGASGK
jgi:hypothetical protein